jgi:hypothetical protein
MLSYFITVSTAAAQSTIVRCTGGCYIMMLAAGHAGMCLGYRMGGVVGAALSDLF